MAQPVIHYYNHNTEVRLSKRQPVPRGADMAKSRPDRVRTDTFRLDKNGKIKAAGIRGDKNVDVDWELTGGVIHLGGRVIKAQRKANGDYTLVEMNRSSHEGGDYVPPHIEARAEEKATRKSPEGPDTETGSTSPDEDEGRGGVTPAAYQFAVENDINLDTIQGSGKDGSITKNDVKTALAARDKQDASE